MKKLWYRLWRWIEIPPIPQCAHWGLPPKGEAWSPLGPILKSAQLLSWLPLRGSCLRSRLKGDSAIRYRPPCGARKTLRAFAFPRVFRPLRRKLPSFRTPCRIAVGGPALHRPANGAAAEIPSSLHPPPAARGRNPATGSGSQLSQRQLAPQGRYSPLSVTGRASSRLSERPPYFLVKMLSVT